jgi:hypothetical protein
VAVVLPPRVLVVAQPALAATEDLASEKPPIAVLVVAMEVPPLEEPLTVVVAMGSVHVMIRGPVVAAAVLRAVVVQETVVVLLAAAVKTVAPTPLLLVVVLFLRNAAPRQAAALLLQPV